MKRHFLWIIKSFMNCETAFSLSRMSHFWFTESVCDKNGNEYRRDMCKWNRIKLNKSYSSVILRHFICFKAIGINLRRFNRHLMPKVFLFFCTVIARFQLFFSKINEKYKGSLTGRNICRDLKYCFVSESKFNIADLPGTCINITSETSELC